MAREIFKIVLLGPKNVGKTALEYRLTKGGFIPTQLKPSIHVDFYTVTIALPDDTEKKLQIWDTAGKETFGNNAAYCKDSDVFMICVNKDANWSEVQSQYEEIVDGLSKLLTTNAKIMVVVTKAEDGMSDGDAITNLLSLISGSAISSRFIEEVYYTNAETGRNVQELFRRAAIIANEADLSNDSVKQHDDDADLRRNGSVEQHLDLTEFSPSDVHTGKKPSLFFSLPTLVGTTTGILAGLTIDGALLGALFFTTTLIVTMPYVAAVVCAAILLGTLLVGMSAGIGYAAYDNHKTSKPHMA